MNDKSKPKEPKPEPKSDDSWKRNYKSPSGKTYLDKPTPKDK